VWEKTPAVIIEFSIPTILYGIRCTLLICSKVFRTSCGAAGTAIQFLVTAIGLMISVISMAALWVTKKVLPLANSALAGIVGTSMLLVAILGLILRGLLLLTAIACHPTQWLSCSHEHLTFPITPRDRSGRIGGSTYVVCLDCGKEFAYRWDEMRLADDVANEKTNLNHGEVYSRPKPEF
jgi:hypothetical protein